MQKFWFALLTIALLTWAGNYSKAEQDLSPDPELEGDIDVELEPEITEVSEAEAEEVAAEAEFEAEAEAEQKDTTSSGRCTTTQDCPNGYACFDGICLFVSCTVDEDCPGKNQICRDSGYCVPDHCSKDSDCLYPDYICRPDKVCAPKSCRTDNDCTYYSYCQGGQCLPNPAFWIHGKGGCTNSSNPWLGWILVLLLAGSRLARKPA